MIKDDIWANPLHYFLATEIDAENGDDEDDDDGDDGEEDEEEDIEEEEEDEDLDDDDEEEAIEEAAEEEGKKCDMFNQTPRGQLVVGWLRLSHPLLQEQATFGARKVRYIRWAFDICFVLPFFFVLPFVSFSVFHCFCLHVQVLEETSCTSSAYCHT